MKYLCNSMMKKEEFPDGDLLIYDDLNETYHILNKTAHEILNLLENEECEIAKALFLSNRKESNVETSVMEEDFNNVLNLLLAKSIIFEEGNNKYIQLN